MDPTAALLDWATQPGPPNYVFILALLTAPHLWSKYVKDFLSEQYQKRISGGGAKA